MSDPGRAASSAYTLPRILSRNSLVSSLALTDRAFDAGDGASMLASRRCNLAYRDLSYSSKFLARRDLAPQCDLKLSRAIGEKVVEILRGACVRGQIVFVKCYKVTETLISPLEKTKVP